ncbi:Bacteriocin-protection, YdeI or OmpD-Associated [Geodermatophilus pulveris]|uniref:Bacteriocin-protection, YdeI or OmpD-Associated n=1 Tax=Geodermatophilus pulveris TaxID=1564159 RepID=A0A239DL52_9ACTN|nr:YdeI/OmpD-associated family protein [Geodermatophilus pulveris]SNS33147.1 Bacteriocin-protection, YdeI or OmpD-Associated [Geodermatophilus pulveris]
MPTRYVPHERVLDHLVAFGWIDGIRRRLDDERTTQLISPRRTQPWPRTYEDRAERLPATGRMQPAGAASVQQASATGMWDAMDDVDALVVPADLADALAAGPPAGDHFAASPTSTRRNTLRWIASARTPPTRARRIALTVDDARRGVADTSNG